MREFRLVLLDDEEIVTNGIQRVFDLKSLGYDLVGVFNNPLKLLEQIEDLKPDLIITDVKMPQMDGLEFSKQVKKVNSEIELVILSGHDEFSFATTAMKIGVSEYLLKPINKKDFTAMLMDMYKRLEEKHEKKNYYDSLKDFVEKNYNDFKNNFFLELADGGDFDEKQYATIRQRSENDILNMSYLLLKADIYQIPAEEDYVSEIGKISQQMIQVLSDYGKIEDFTNDESLFFILYDLQGEDTVEIRALMENLVRGMQRTGVRLAMGISQLHQGPEEFFAARNDCIRQIFMHAMHIDESSEANPVRQEKANRNVPYGEIEELFRAISVRDAATAKETIEKLYINSGERNLYEGYGITITFLILLRMCQMQNKYPENYHMINEKFLELPYLQKICPTMNELRSLVEKFVTGLIDLLSQESSSEPSKMILSAVNYINQHYRENISLTDVADNVNISKNYLCDVFKKELGISFMNYITNLRMEKAKEFLSNTDMKMYEISEAVGYSDYAYFSQIFKKHTGTTLSAYRKQN